MERTVVKVNKHYETNGACTEVSQEVVLSCAHSFKMAINVDVAPHDVTDCADCDRAAPEPEGPRVERHLRAGGDDELRLYIGGRLVKNWLASTWRQARRETLLPLVPLHLHSHLPRLYRELGIAEEPPIATCDEGIAGCDANPHRHLQRDPSVIHTELGEFRVEREPHLREWRITAPKGHWSLTDEAGDDRALQAMRALSPVFERLGIAETKPATRTVVQATKGTPTTGAIAYHDLAVEWPTPQPMHPDTRRYMARAIEGMHASAGLPPSAFGHIADAAAYAMDEARKAKARAELRTRALKAGESQGTARTELARWPVDWEDPRAIKWGLARYGGAMLCVLSQMRMNGHRGIAEFELRASSASLLAAELGVKMPLVQPRQLILTFMGYRVILGDRDVCVFYNESGKDKTQPACTPEEQVERTKAVKEKLFAKRSARPSVGWDPEGTWEDD